MWNISALKNRSALVIASFITLCMPCLAAAQQTCELKLHVVPGQKWSFDATSAIKQKGEVTTNGQPAQEINSAANQHRKGTLEVLAVEDGKPSAMRVSFDADSSSSGNLGGQPVPTFSLAGKTVTLRRGEGGTTTNDLAEAPDDQTLQELNHMIDPDTSVFPGHAVTIDDQWDANTANLAKQFQLGPDDTVSMKCKLLAIKELDGRQVADVSVTGQVVKHDQGFIETTTTLGGVTRVDLLTGQTLAADIIGKMSSRGSKQVDGPNGAPVKIEVNADGEIESHQSVRPVGGDATVEAQGAAPAMHDNPLAPRHASLAGSYKGDELSLVIAGDPSHYTGSLTLQDKTYPVVAHSDGKSLAGTFESDGNNFDFTATLDGSTLTLSSGGNTYTLKKAAANPLARPKPKNPLAQ